jgi:hypothetical protein
VAVRGNCPCGTSRHAQFAFKTWIVGKWLVVGGGLRTDQDGPQLDEIAELGVDDIAVDAHVTEAGSDGDRLVRYNPNLSATPSSRQRKAWTTG